MKFDYTKGRDARYKVTIYGWNVEDTYFFHTHDEAKRFYDKLKAKPIERGYIISIREVDGVKSNSYVRL